MIRLHHNGDLSDFGCAFVALCMIIIIMGAVA